MADTMSDELSVAEHYNKKKGETMKSLIIQRIAQNDRPQERFTYTVTGTPPFPHDMLRYDCAFPVDENDAAAMESMTYRYLSVTEMGRHIKVTLMSHKHPTLARWESFGWKVV